jgi:hypothetical protein
MVAAAKGKAKILTEISAGEIIQFHYTLVVKPINMG